MSFSKVELKAAKNRKELSDVVVNTNPIESLKGQEPQKVATQLYLLTAFGNFKS